MNPVDKRAIGLVSLLPVASQVQLAMGPIPPEAEWEGPYAACCRVCVALEDLVFNDDADWMYYKTFGEYREPFGRARRAALRLWNWHHCHDLSDGGGRFDYGNCPEGYRRCLVLYRAAGWDGRES